MTVIKIESNVSILFVLLRQKKGWQRQILGKPGDSHWEKQKPRV